MQSYAVLMQLKAAQTENKRNNYDMTELVGNSGYYPLPATSFDEWVLLGTIGYYWVVCVFDSHVRPLAAGKSKKQQERQHQRHSCLDHWSNIVGPSDQFA